MHRTAIRNREKLRAVAGREVAIEVDATVERVDPCPIARDTSLAVRGVHSGVLDLDHHAGEWNPPSVCKQAKRHRRARAKAGSQQIVR